MQQQYGQAGLAILEEWFALLQQLQDQDIQAKLRGVNDFFNRRIRWVDDIQGGGGLLGHAFRSDG